LKNINDLPIELQWLLHRTKIQDVVIRTCVSLDDRNWAEYMECFTADAEISYSHKPELFTPKTFIENVAMTSPQYEVSQHVPINIATELYNDKATCRTQVVSYFGSTGKPMDGIWRAASAVYRDTLIYRSGEWQITARQATVQWVEGNA
jgi:SnoaL-like domain